MRLTHKPTGLVVTCRMRNLSTRIRPRPEGTRSRLLDLRIAEEQAKYAAERKAQVGTGERNERIRTYNFTKPREHLPSSSRCTAFTVYGRRDCRDVTIALAA